MEITILIVDDVKANLISLRALLEEIDTNYKIIEANNGTEALEIALSFDLDLIILDIQMPDIDGFEVAKLLKSNKKTTEIPIIFLTAAFKSDEFVNRGFELGAVDYLTKPIDQNQFINRITLYTKLFTKIYENREKDKVLHQQTKMAAMGEMIGNIAHQWRQPLSLISTAATGIKMQKLYGMINEESELEYLDKINDTAQYLSQTIDDFRNYINNDTIKGNFNLSKSIEKALKLENSVLLDTSITIIKDFDDTIILNNYENKLIQVFINIINNAKDALLEKNKDEKLLLISTKQIDTQVIISFQDNGTGINEEVLDKVFEAYFTTKHKKQGTGLGLFMSYNIITTQMDGNIKIENSCFIHNNKKFDGANVKIFFNTN